MFIKGNVCTETRPGKLELDRGLGFWPLALVCYTRFGEGRGTAWDIQGFLGCLSLAVLPSKAHCAHEIKRGLLLGRKAMTNLDSVLKSRGIILPTKVHLVKAVVFPVVMYGCESWTIKKAEHQRMDVFKL